MWWDRFIVWCMINYWWSMMKLMKDLLCWWRIYYGWWWNSLQYSLCDVIFMVDEKTCGKIYHDDVIFMIDSMIQLQLMIKLAIIFIARCDKFCDKNHCMHVRCFIVLMMWYLWLMIKLMTKFIALMMNLFQCVHDKFYHQY